MKVSIPLSIEQNSAGAVNEQSRYGEKEDARGAIAIKGVDALGLIAICGEDRRQNGDGQCCDQYQMEDQHSAHDALSVHQAFISPGD